MVESLPGSIFSGSGRQRQNLAKASWPQLYGPSFCAKIALAVYIWLGARMERQETMSHRPDRDDMMRDPSTG
jgi:hypothetical protein